MEDHYKELIEAIATAQEAAWEDEKNQKNQGTRENPYLFYHSQRTYDHMKENNLIDEDDLYMSIRGWTKVIVVKLEKD